MHHANATREQDRANKSSERGSFLFKKPNSEALQDQREHLICRLVIVVVLDPISIIDGNQLMDSPKVHLYGGKQEIEVGAPSLVLSHWTFQCIKIK